MAVTLFNGFPLESIALSGHGYFHLILAPTNDMDARNTFQHLRLRLWVRDTQILFHFIFIILGSVVVDLMNEEILRSVIKSSI